MKGWKGPRRPCQISACVMSCNELLCWVPLCPFFFVRWRRLGSCVLSLTCIRSAFGFVDSFFFGRCSS